MSDEVDIATLTPLQRAIVPLLDHRGIRGTWVRSYGSMELALKMAESRAPSTVSVRFDDPAELKGWRLSGWRVGTMEELKIARPTIYELCQLTNDAAALALHYAYWRATTVMDWDGGPGEGQEMPSYRA